MLRVLVWRLPEYQGGAGDPVRSNSFPTHSTISSNLYYAGSLPFNSTWRQSLDYLSWLFSSDSSTRLWSCNTHLLKATLNKV